MNIDDASIGHVDEVLSTTRAVRRRLDLDRPVDNQLLLDCIDLAEQAPTGGNNPALLAHGISVALYNTAFGLIIAIPSLMFYRYFRGLVDAYTLDLEQAAHRIVPHLMRFSVPRTAA